MKPTDIESPFMVKKLKNETNNHLPHLHDHRRHRRCQHVRLAQGLAHDDLLAVSSDVDGFDYVLRSVSR